MKLKKIGKIFDPSDYKIGNETLAFAQSPQALVFDSCIRIYFSTRIKDVTGKYLSKISYVDINKDFKSIIKVAQHEIIPLGNLGCYDEHGIFPLNILKHQNQIYGFIGGWNRRKSVQIDGAIGLAISNNSGESFERIGNGPVMASTFNEPFLIADPFVQHYNEHFHMWYIFGNKWIFDSETNQPERVYRIAYAKSKDAINWDRNGHFIIPTRLENDLECQALPTVLRIGDVYHMYFCYRHAIDFRKTKGKGYQLGYAFSNDGINWKRDDSLAGISLSSEGWDSDMMCYPNLFHCDGKNYLLYNGNEFGKFGFGIAEIIN